MSSSLLNLDNQTHQETSIQGLSLDTNTANDIIYLISNEAQTDETLKLSITKKQASNSKLFSTTIDSDPNVIDIPLPEIKQSILIYIVDFLVHYNGETIPMPEKPARSEHMKDNTTEWNANFIDSIAKNKLELYALISAANFIHCESLLHLACCKVASMIKNIPLSEIKKTLMDEQKDNKKEEENK